LSAQRNRLEVERRADDELGAGLDASTRGFRIQHGARADDDFGIDLGTECLDDSTAPGTVMVISRTEIPPLRMAATARRAMSVDSARTTGIIPIAVSRLMTSALLRDFMMTSFQLLAGHARAGALHDLLDFGQGCHGGVARGSHGQGPVRGPAVQRPLRRSAARNP